MIIHLGQCVQQGHRDRGAPWLGGEAFREVDCKRMECDMLRTASALGRCEEGESRCCKYREQRCKLLSANVSRIVDNRNSEVLTRTAAQVATRRPMFDEDASCDREE